MQFLVEITICFLIIWGFFRLGVSIGLKKININTKIKQPNYVQYSPQKLENTMQNLDIVTDSKTTKICRTNHHHHY